MFRIRDDRWIAIDRLGLKRNKALVAAENFNTSRIFDGQILRAPSDVDFAIGRDLYVPSLRDLYLQDEAWTTRVRKEVIPVICPQREELLKHLHVSVSSFLV